MRRRLVRELRSPEAPRAERDTRWSLPPRPVPRGVSSWTMALAFLASSAMPVVGWLALSDGVTRWERDRRAEIERWPSALRSTIDALGWLGEPPGVVVAVVLIGALCRLRYRAWPPAAFVAGIVAVAGAVANVGSDALQPWAERIQGELLDSQTRERFPAQAAMVGAAVWWNSAVHLRFLAPQASRVVGPVLVAAGAAAGLAPVLDDRAEVFDVAGGWVLGGVVAAIGGGIAVSVHRWGRQRRRRTGAAPIGGVEIAEALAPGGAPVEPADTTAPPSPIRPVGAGDWVPDTRPSVQTRVGEAPTVDTGPAPRAVWGPDAAPDADVGSVVQRQSCGEGETDSAVAAGAGAPAGATDGEDPLVGWVKGVAAFFDGPGPNGGRGSRTGRARSDD